VEEDTMEEGWEAYWEFVEEHWRVLADEVDKEAFLFFGGVPTEPLLSGVSFLSWRPELIST
jgi:hypothetical protein